MALYFSEGILWEILNQYGMGHFLFWYFAENLDILCF